MEVRVCPHCGVSVSGETDRCPNCDRRLAIDTDPIHKVENPAPNIGHEQVLTVVDRAEPVPNEISLPEDIDQPASLENLVVSPRISPKPVPEPSEGIILDTVAHEATQDQDDNAENVEDEDSEIITAPRDDAPIATREAYLSAFGEARPIQPAARVPEPEPLPPLESTPAKEPVSTRQVVIPSAPFTPPPVTQPIQSPQPMTSYQPALPYGQPQYAPGTAYGAPALYSGAHAARQSSPSGYWLSQRIQAYQLGGYRPENKSQWDALLSVDKGLPALWWVVAILSVFGLIWYFLLLLSSGFRRDKVYIGLEPDGYVFEEGSGAAHTRRRRERSSRRWAVAGIILAILSIIMFFLLLVAASVVVNNYETELAAAFPEIEYFRNVNVEGVSAIDEENARLIGLVMAVLFAFSVLGMIGGVMMAVISYIQAAAYRVNVAPLPGYE